MRWIEVIAKLKEYFEIDVLGTLSSQFPFCFYACSLNRANVIFLVQRAHPGYVYSQKDRLFVPGPAVGTDDLSNVPGMGLGMAQVTG